MAKRSNVGVTKTSPPPQPPHVPTDQMRADVEKYASTGSRHEDIALVIGIDDKTLRKHYRKELDRGKAMANVAIGGKTYNEAMAGNATLLIWWAKTQMGWREAPQTVELTGKNGGPITTRDVSLLSEEQILERLSRLHGGTTPPGVAGEEEIPPVAH